MKKKTHRSRRSLITHILAALFLLAGAMIALYPFYVGALNDVIDNHNLNVTQQANAKNAASKIAAMRKANAKRTAAGLNANADPFSGLAKQNTKALKRDMIGDVTVPGLKLTLPLFKTLSDQTLEVGAAVVPGTSLPVGGTSTHAVIAGHRGLVDRRLFSDLNRVHKGDIFVFKVYGKHLAYKVFRIEVVLPNDTSTLKIEAGRDLATLLTCTPYMVNSHRLLITGKRVPYTAAIAKEVTDSQATERLQQLSIFGAAIAAMMAVVALLLRYIHGLLLRRRTFDLTFKRVTPAGVAVAGAKYQLLRRSGKALRRNGELFTATANADGVLTFMGLPGDVYQVREIVPGHTLRFKVGVKRLKQTHAQFYLRRRDVNLVRSVDGDWQIVAPVATQEA